MAAAIPNRLKSVLIVIKKSCLHVALETNDQRTLQLIEEGDESVAFFEKAHEEQEAAVASVLRLLSERSINHRVVDRSELTGDPSNCEAVLSIGGDGTFLDIAHSLVNTPLLGINPTSTSFGHYCLANPGNLAQVLDNIEAGTCLPLPLLRLEASINGQVLPERILNEISYADIDRLSTSRYLITVDSRHEEHQCSGILIGPPAGSTGWLRSAGGVVLPVTERKIIYRVREPALRPGLKYTLLGGVLDESGQIEITSKMSASNLGIDGSRVKYLLERGDRLLINKASKDLAAYISADVNNAFMA